MPDRPVSERLVTAAIVAAAWGVMALALAVAALVAALLHL